MEGILFHVKRQTPPSTACRFWSQAVGCPNVAMGVKIMAVGNNLHALWRGIPAPASADGTALHVDAAGTTADCLLPLNSPRANQMQVSWSGIPAPTNADGIALYVNAPGTTVNGLSPLKWQWANKSPGYAQANGAYSSSGSLVCVALAPM